MVPEQIDYTKESVLIVDDDVYLSETLEKLLEALGFSARSTTNGIEALEILKGGEYTFVLTDMKMPEMGGMELIERISKDISNLNIIAMTGYTEGYKYVDVINAGASDFIKKPFNLEELEAKIRRIITERNLRRELNRLSITDSLTDLYNQRHFYSRLQEEVTRAKRQRHPLSLILLDLDKFKEYNDTYGHLAGDDVLRTAGQIINRCIRVGVDSGYRYGGDEFAIILIDADLEIANDIGMRVQNAFRENGEIEVSLGYAKYSEGMEVKDLVADADKELYKDKMARKNNA
jgi:two-component system cell cycle response regulator